jgi:hypothetical protein
MSQESNRPDDELLAQEEELAKVSAAARLFDVRRVIGGLFVVYGVIVTLLGIFDSPSEIDKAQGVRINLWMGLAMLALGAFFLLWLRWRPTELNPTGTDRSDETGPQPPAGT